MWQRLFGRRPRIASLEELSRFCDRQAAFNCQKNIYEFVRARSSVHSTTLFEEEAFKDALEKARWKAYPVALLNMLEMVSGVLREELSPEDAMARVLPVCQRMGRTILDSYATAQPLSPEEWQAMTAKALDSLPRILSVPPKPVKDIPVPRSKIIYDLIPLHNDMKAPDFKTIENHQRINLCRAHDELMRIMDRAALLADLGLPTGRQRAAV